MKARYSEEYYRKYWERFENKYKRYWSPEEHLDYEMRHFEKLPEEAKAIIIKIEAKKISDAMEKELRQKMRIIKDIEAGRASLGYTSQIQEIKAMHDMVEGFEFGCLQLADFRKKYNIA